MQALNAIIALGLASAAVCLGIGLLFASSELLPPFVLTYGVVVGFFSMYAAFLLFAVVSVVMLVRLATKSAAGFVASFSFSALNALFALAGALFLQYGRV